MQVGDKGLYLFCFARPGRLDHLSAGVGTFGFPVIMQLPMASAVVSEIALDDFCGPRAEQNLQDLAWLAPRACLHEKVIEEAMQGSPVLPAPFGTIFSSLARLEEYARKHNRLISQFLDRVEDQEEWGVKVLLERANADRLVLLDDLQTRQEELAALPPGRRYLQAKKIRTEAERALRPRLKEICGTIEESLRRAASGFARRRVVDKSGLTKDAEIILNWAFLVARSNLPAFRKEVDDADRNYAAMGLILSLSGPWPPYSFAPAPGDEAAGA